MCDIPSSIIQEEKKRCKNHICVHRRVKVVVLEGDPKCPQLVACSVYGTKPVHFLSMVCEELKWMVMEKQVINVDSRKKETMRCLRMNTIHRYNMMMGSIYLADKLCRNYHIDNGVKNRTWWWSVMFWSIGVMLTNAYTMYVKVREANGLEKKDVLSHHDF
eukprot:9005108-Ditylum_brightwellii.AAC.1